MTALDIVLAYLRHEYMPRRVAEAYAVLCRSERLDVENFGLGAALVPKTDGRLLRLEDV